MDFFYLNYLTSADTVMTGVSIILILLALLLLIALYMVSGDHRYDIIENRDDIIDNRDDIIENQDDVTRSYSYTVFYKNMVEDAKESDLLRFRCRRSTTRLFKDIKESLIREVREEIENISPRGHSNTDHVAAVDRMSVDDFDREILKYYGLIIATSKGNYRAMRQFLEDGVKPTGPDDDTCMLPLLIAMKVGPKAIKLLLEYGALWTNKANEMLKTDYIISSPYKVVKTLIAAGHRQSLSFLRLDESAGKVKPDNDKAKWRIEDIKALLRQPMSLRSLSRQAVAQCLGPMPGRRLKMPSTELPLSCQEDLCVADWIDLSLDGNSGKF